MSHSIHLYPSLTINAVCRDTLLVDQTLYIEQRRSDALTFYLEGYQSMYVSDAPRQSFILCLAVARK